MNVALLLVLLSIAPAAWSQSSSGGAPVNGGLTPDDLIDRAIALKKGQKAPNPQPQTGDVVAECEIERVKAVCHYDASGNVKFWIFNVRTGNGDRFQAFTGFPQVLAIHGAYSQVLSSLWPIESALERQLNYSVGAIDTRDPVTVEAWDRQLKRITPFVPENVLRRLSTGVRFDLQILMRSVFLPWQLKSDDVYKEVEPDFPPRKTGELPGAMTVRTFRVPLYVASDRLLAAWSEFWIDCGQASPAGKEFDGCRADFAGFVRGPALQEAEAASYPTSALAARAAAVAAAADSARRFSEATRELVPFGKFAWGDTDHLEPGDIPAELLPRIQAAEAELDEAMKKIPDHTRTLGDKLEKFVDDGDSAFYFSIPVGHR